MITIKLLREWNACWFDNESEDGSEGEDRIVEISGGRASMSPRDVAGLDVVSLNDRLWVICRALWYRNEAAARTYAIDSAALVSHLAGRPEDQAEHARLLVDLRRIYTLPDDQQSAALDGWESRRRAAAAAEAAEEAAAWAAAAEAAWAAAAEAAAEAARAAAEAAWAAAWAAAEAAGRAAAWAAAWAAEMQKAIDRALTALGPDADGWSADE